MLHPSHPSRAVPAARRRVSWLFGALAAAVTILIGVLVGPALAATGTLYASGATNPNGQLWLAGDLGGHLWVADHLQGLCRVDAASGTLEGATCATAAKAAGQPAFDAAHNFVYVPDSATTGGVVRFTYNPASETIGNPVSLAPSAGLAGNKPDAVALGPDGNLYVSFLKNGNIVRITNPAGATQTAQSAGGTSDGRRALSLAFSGTDLFVAETSGVTRIFNVTASTCTGGCKAGTVGLNAIGAPLSLTVDGSTLYIGDASKVSRYNLSTGALDTYATSGTSAFQNVTGLGVDPTGNLYVGDDPSAGALNLQGRIWSVAAGSAPAPTLPPPPPPAPAGGGAPLTTGTLYAQGETNPTGQFKLDGALGGHLWVADHLQGVCRVAGGTIEGATCQTAAVAPGEPSVDAARNFVYVPDQSMKSQGVIRYTYNPASETLGDPVVLAPNAGLGPNKPVATALGPDGALYVSFLKNGNVVKILNPDGATQTVQSVGGSSDGKRILAMTFHGQNLYLAETGQVARIANATSAVCTGGCKGAGIGLTGIASPLSLASSSTDVFIGTASAVYRYTPATNANVTYVTSGTAGTNTFSMQNVSGLGVDTVTGDLYVGDDPTAGGLNLQGRIWRVAPPA